MADYDKEGNEPHHQLNQQENTFESSHDSSKDQSYEDHVTPRDPSEEEEEEEEHHSPPHFPLHPPPHSPLSDDSFGNDLEEEGVGTLKRPHPQDSDEEEDSRKSIHKKVRLNDEEEEEKEGEIEKGEVSPEEEEMKGEQDKEEEGRNFMAESDKDEQEELVTEEKREEDKESDDIEEHQQQEDDDNELLGGQIQEEEEEEEEEEDLEDTEAQELLQQQEQQGTSGQDREESGDSGVEENKEDTSISDFDLMMQRRKEAMAKARRRRKKDIDITTNDDHILAMIRQMKEAAEEDRRLNLQQKAATKKLQLLSTILTHLKKTDLLTAMIECGMCSALADWLKPLPDHSLPHLKIREGILDSLKTFPSLDGHILKTSGLGKAIMLLYKHPKEIKKNREKAGKLINSWARPVFGLTADFKGLSRDEREERDWAHLSQAARRRLSSDSREADQSRMDEQEPQKPGDKGWIGRARVPMPSNKDYVVRPKWNKQQEFTKSSSKRTLNRYEKQVQKKKEKMTRGKNTHAVSISIEGRNMSL